MVEIDETLIDNTVGSLLNIVQTLVLRVGTVILNAVGDVIDSKFGNSVGVLILVSVFGATAYMVVRKAQTG